jgi:hypothetical protein
MKSMIDALINLEERARRTGETLTIRISGNATWLVWSRGRGRRAERLTTVADELSKLLPIFEERIPNER